MTRKIVIELIGTEGQLDVAEKVYAVRNIEDTAMLVYEKILKAGENYKNFGWSIIFAEKEAEKSQNEVSEFKEIEPNQPRRKRTFTLNCGNCKNSGSDPDGELEGLFCFMDGETVYTDFVCEDYWPKNSENMQAKR